MNCDPPTLIPSENRNVKWEKRQKSTSSHLWALVMSGVITDYYLVRIWRRGSANVQLRDGSDGKFSSRKRQSRVRGEGGRRGLNGSNAGPSVNKKRPLRDNRTHLLGT
ncbi:hypothetical protein PV10_08378 [Exophiala mesophila]|uniref:Uncharacterized protein n=1 Tax=Exophiala mesophila TaxID=212818 RepID=A0A0D1Z475_EXOME|nr:uncharacterized protein PV10_08378 [Exophiala mesophila]KIV88724.1 hypothetical protein PV10_08378 [Exophiala mesophila]